MHYTTVQSVELYARCVFEANDLVEIRPLPSGSSEWHVAEKLAEQSARLHAANLAGQNIYVGVNPRRRVGGRCAADVQLARCLFADFDGNPSIGETMKRLAKAGLPEPTLAVHSGHGLHFYWDLAEPITDLTAWTKLQKALSAALGSDPKIHDPPRVMRLPGFDNCKSHEHVPCFILDSDPTRRYPIDQLQEILALHIAALSVQHPAVHANRIGTDGNRIARFWGAATRIESIDKGDGSSRLLMVARQAVRFDLADDVAIDQIERYQRAFPFPKPWNPDDIRRRLRDAEKQCARGEGLHRRQRANIEHKFEGGLTSGNTLPPPIARAFERAIERRAKTCRKGGAL